MTGTNAEEDVMVNICGLKTNDGSKGTIDGKEYTYKCSGAHSLLLSAISLLIVVVQIWAYQIKN